MTKDTKKPNDLLPHFIFIGRCWTKKYEKMAKKVTAYLESTYNNRVTILCRVKRPTPLIQKVSFGLLLMSCVLFLILMFSQPVLDLLKLSYIQNYIDPYKIPIYLVGLFCFLLSRFITVTRTFDVYVDNDIVYKKSKQDRLKSFEEITEAIDYYFKKNVNHYEYYLKKKEE